MPKKKADRHKPMCKLAKEGAHEEDPEGFFAMLDTPRFICMKCGRAANKKKNLCDPKKVAGATEPGEG